MSYMTALLLSVIRMYLSFKFSQKILCSRYLKIIFINECGLEFP